MGCGGLLPLSARRLAGALGAGSKLPARKAGVSSRTPNRHDFNGTLLARAEARVVTHHGVARLPCP